MEWVTGIMQFTTDLATILGAIVSLEALIKKIYFVHGRL